MYFRLFSLITSPKNYDIKNIVTPDLPRRTLVDLKSDNNLF